MKVGPYSVEIRAVTRRRENAVFLCEDSKKAATCRPSRVTSPKPDYTGSLTLNFQPPEIGENKLSHPVYSILLCQPKILVQKNMTLQQMPKSVE